MTPEATRSLPEGAERIGPLLRHHVGRICRATAIRWVLKGLRTPDGSFIKLRAWRIGNYWYTTSEAVTDFLAAVTISNITNDQPQVRSPRERERASSAAKAELKKLGL